ncbi:hypothetical protein [Massilia aerilata]|uniref:Uncharacterized protein n=1 Tax=Massilia aerilata TaxID=453817 RepID=A0ABW0RZ28_9BURK
MTQRLDEQALQDACLDLARVVLAAGHAQVSNDILETLADRFHREVVDFAPGIARAGRDPNLLTRAVHYIIDAHALPLMGTDMTWFRQALVCLVELAAPGIALSDKGGAFLRDVQLGVEQSLGDLEG